MNKAVFRQASNIFGITVVSNCGVISPVQLAELGKLAVKVEALGCKFTTRQTLILLIHEEKINYVTNEVEKLGLKIGCFDNVIRNVKGCSGNKTLCTRALSDALDLAIDLQNQYMGQPVPKDFKISVAGCSRGCTDPLCADFGIIATGKNEYSIYLGGKGSSQKPKHGYLILKNISSSSIPKVLDYVLTQYKTNAIPFERINKTIERIGINNFIPPSNIVSIQESNIDEDFLKMLNM